MAAKRRHEVPYLGRDWLHLEHVTNGIKGGPHGGDKQARSRRERRAGRRESHAAIGDGDDR